jgi:hypothetical protein
LLLIAGTGEFVRSGAQPAEPGILEVLREAYSSLPYDLGLASPQEAEAFTASGVALPGGFFTSREPAYRSFSIKGKTVGVVIFPDIGTAKEAPEQAMARVDALVMSKRAEADLIVGLSPWGYWAEQAYLKSSPRHAVDILLGSGPGVEMPGSAQAGGRTWWVRAYGRGKYVLKIDVESWPEKDGHVWTQNKDIRTEPVVLTDGYVEDVDMLSIIWKAEQQ